MSEIFRSKLYYGRHDGGVDNDFPFAKLLTCDGDINKGVLNEGSKEMVDMVTHIKQYSTTHI